MEDIIYMLQISPSVLSADFTKLGEECTDLLKAGVDMLHFDIMDGHFTPNITFGMPVLKSISEKIPAVYDIHLMLDQPEKYAKRFIQAGADYVTFHVENTCDTKALIDEIHENNAKAGLSLNPKTDVTKLEPYLKDLELVLVMTVEPGFSGQSFMYNGVSKIEWLEAQRKENGYNYIIMIDGGINLETATLCKGKGADAVVTGAYMFTAPDYKVIVDGLKQI